MAQSTANRVKIDKNILDPLFEPRRIFLLVGVNEFKDQDFRNLRYTSKDTTKLKSFLKHHRAQKSDIFISLNDTQATQKNILKALGQIERLNRSPQDTILMYFSSHGSLDYGINHQLERFIVTHDSDFKRLSATALSINYIENRMMRLISKKKALILALCHSGGGKSRLPSEIKKEAESLKAHNFPKPIHEASGAFMILSASSWHEAAREDAQLEHDIYTHYLIKGLASHDTNQDGVISLFEAHEYARTQTYDHTQGRQTPSIWANISGVDPIILNGREKNLGLPMIYADDEQWRRMQVQVDGQSRGSLWQAKSAPAGTVHLKVFHPSRPDEYVADHQVHLEAGRNYPLSALLVNKPRVHLGLRLSMFYLSSTPDNLSVSDRFAPGMEIQQENLFGRSLRLGGNISIYTQEKSYELDQNPIDVLLQGYQAQVFVGSHQRLFNHQNASLDLGIQWARLARSLDNASFAQKNQVVQSYDLFVRLAYSARFFEENLYATAGIELYPFNHQTEQATHRVIPYLTTGVIL
ncbi:MAG: caspase family protein [Pseudobacteriovorax sp.]|nr:caspase family protein [Pseudobacteriovorax sp.]